jgi:hypothetical protein
MAGKIIYHKHWIILLKHAWPVLAFYWASSFSFWRHYHSSHVTELSFIRTNAAGSYSPDTFLVAVPNAPVTPAGRFWLWYEYTDWKNDIFMVTER